MAIHGIVSTYFGDYEYDIGKSLSWTQNFVDDVYILDSNISGSHRQFIVNWDYTFPNAKYSFYSKSFFGSATTAANWRKESFSRAKAAFNYDNNDWVLFIDGTECLNVFNKPPRSVTVVSAEMDNSPTLDYPNGGYVTFTTDSPHGISAGNVVLIESANIVDGTETYNLDGRYEVLEVPASDEFKVYQETVLVDTIDDLVNPATVLVTEEPYEYVSNGSYKSWLEYEINNSTENLISLDGWALLHSAVPEEETYTVVNSVGGSSTLKVRSSEKRYVSMKRLVRLAKVSSLSDPDFDWTVLDQSANSPDNSHPAERLSLISFAYCRWADSPDKMTQSVDSAAPNHVAYPPDYPFKPVNRVDDIGYTCRQYISTVRPILDSMLDPVLPVSELDWGVTDPDGTQPLVGTDKKLEAVLYPVYSYVDGDSVITSFRNYGGQQAYTNVFRNNLREGLWFTNQGPPPRSTVISNISLSGSVVTATTPKAHNLFPGYTIVVYGTDGIFDGQYVVTDTTSNSFSFNMVVESGYVPPPGPYPDAYAVTKPNYVGPIPWDYAANAFAVSDPKAYISQATSNVRIR